MAGPNTNYTDVAAATIELRSRKIADNVSKNTALLKKLAGNGQIKLVDGGVKILREISWQENGTFRRYSGLNLAPLAA